MGKEGKRLKRCSASTSTDVEGADHKGTKPLQKAETELHNSESDVNPKKLKKKSESKQIDLEPKKKHKKTYEKKKEMKKLRKLFKEMTETMKNLHDYFILRADLPGISLKEILLSTALEEASSKEEKEEEEEESPEELGTYECCFETEDSDTSNTDSIYVGELDTCLARDDIKTALREHFESLGCQVTRVFVPIECLTGVPLGFAFVDVDDEEKALKLSNRFLGNRLVFVTSAEKRSEAITFPDFEGCKHCGTILLKRRMKRFLNPRNAYRYYDENGIYQ